MASDCSEDRQEVEVVVRGGRYFVTDSLELGMRDSGSPGKPVVWRAAAGEKPQLNV